MKVLFLSEAPLIKYGLAEGFKQAGHESMCMMGEEWRLWDKKGPEQQALVAKAIDIFKPDMVFTEGYAGCHLESIAPMLKLKRIPLMVWTIEDPVTLHISNYYAGYADYVWTTTVERLPHYQNKLEKPAGLLLFGCNPEFHKTVEPKEEFKHDIVLVAANYSNRYDKADWFIKPLLDSGKYDIKIWGPWWNDPTRPINLDKYPGVYGGMLPYEDLCSVYCSAKIVLGMNCDGSSKTQTSMRPYEALACGGGVFVAHFTKAQGDLFGLHMFQTMNAVDTMTKIDWLLSEEEDIRKEHAKEAQQFVYETHSYKLRAEQIVKAFNTL